MRVEVPTLRLRIHVQTYTSAIEPVSAQVIEQVAMLAFLAAYDWCQEEKWCDSIHRLDSLDHLIASLRSDFRIAFRAKTGADPGE